MGSKAMVMLSFISPRAKTSPSRFFKFGQSNPSSPLLTRRLHDRSRSRKNHQTIRNFSSDNSGLDSPDVARLAETARISLTPDEVQEFGPKIKEVINWFGQLQTVDLESIEPAIRADTEAENIRDDLPEPFANRESIIAALPSYEEPYVKVPKVLNKE